MKSNVKIDREYIKSFITSTLESVPELDGDFASIFDQGHQLYFEEAQVVRFMSEDEINSLIKNKLWMLKFFNAWVEEWVNAGYDPEVALKTVTKNYLKLTW